MASSLRFPYLPVEPRGGEGVLRPMMPITLEYGDQFRTVTGLLDTGADVNVLPYQLGLDLGAVWAEQRVSVQLSGNMAAHEARGIILTATVGTFAPVRMAFAWTQTPGLPLILGQTNFFMAFAVCFYRTQGFFEVHFPAEEK